MMKRFMPRGRSAQTDARQPADSALVCVPITAFPTPGGMRGVLAGVAQVMAGEWRLEYLTAQRGKQSEGLVIHTFGGRLAMYWHFPNALFYFLLGWRKLLALLRRHDYHLLLPQDGLYTGAFAALAGKLMGVRVVCMDHGSLTLPYSPVYRRERLNGIRAQRWPERLISRARLCCYWPLLRLLARITVRYSDLFLIAGDEVEDTLRRRFGVHSGRIIRYPYMVDVNRFTPPDPPEKARRRAQQGIAEDAIVVAIISRLAPEKGLGLALQGMQQALAALPADLRARVRFIIAGVGPMRAELEAEVARSDLRSCCAFYGEAAPAEVERLLSISDVFLYTSTRGTNYSVAVLEAMAAGCAVIASVEPCSHARILAEGRGLPIPVGDVAAIAEALTRAISDAPLRQQMGLLARNYIAVYHSAEVLRRCLRQALSAPLARESARAGQQQPSAGYLEGGG